MNVIQSILNIQAYFEQYGVLPMNHGTLSTNESNRGGNKAEDFVEDIYGNTIDIHDEERNEILDQLFIVRDDKGKIPDLAPRYFGDLIEVKRKTLTVNKNKTFGGWKGEFQFNSANAKNVIDLSCNITENLRRELILSKQTERNMLYFTIGTVGNFVHRMYITEGKLFANLPGFDEEFDRELYETIVSSPRFLRFLKNHNIIIEDTTEIIKFAYPDGTKKRIRKMVCQPSFGTRFEDIYKTDNKVNFELVCILTNKTFSKYDIDIPSKDVIIKNKLTDEIFNSKLITLIK